MSANGVDAAVVRRVGTAFGLALVAWVAAANAQPAVMLHGSAVSVQSRGQPLAAVLRALADSTGIVVKGADTLSQIVRWDLDRVNVADGLRRLLDGQNYLLIEGAAGQPTRVIVVGSAHETGPAPGVSPVPSRRPPPPGCPNAIFRRMAMPNPTVTLESCMPNAALTRDFTVAVFVVHDHRVLLHFHQKLDRWLPPGGHIEANELPDEAAVREVMEETSLEVDALKLIGRDDGDRKDCKHICGLFGWSKS